MLKELTGHLPGEGGDVVLPNIDKWGNDKNENFEDLGSEGPCVEEMEAVPKLMNVDYDEID